MDGERDMYASELVGKHGGKVCGFVDGGMEGMEGRCFVALASASASVLERGRVIRLFFFVYIELSPFAVSPFAVWVHA